MTTTATWRCSDCDTRNNEQNLTCAICDAARPAELSFVPRQRTVVTAGVQTASATRPRPSFRPDVLLVATCGGLTVTVVALLGTHPVAYWIVIWLLAASGLALLLLRRLVGRPYRRGPRRPFAGPLRPATLGTLFSVCWAVSACAAVALQYLMHWQHSHYTTQAMARSIAAGVPAGLGITTPLFALVLGWRKQQIDEGAASVFLPGEKSVSPPAVTADPAEIITYSSRLVNSAEIQGFGWQQTIDALCLYLQSAAPLANGPDDRSKRALTAPLQSLIALHLRMAENAGGLSTWWFAWRRSARSGHKGWWPHINVNLSNSVLVNFNFSWCRVREACFNGTTFVGRTQFVRARFEGSLFVEDARFEASVDFAGAVFERGVHFDRSVFVQPVVFTGVQGAATFAGARFYAAVHFPDPCPAFDLGGAYLAAATVQQSALPAGWTLLGEGEWVTVVRPAGNEGPTRSAPERAPNEGEAR